MPFIPHTQEQVVTMLEKLGIKKIDDLFADIPKDIFRPEFSRDLPSLDEIALNKHMQKCAGRNFNGVHFLGAGAYAHYIPPTVWALASRGEFMTAYTPYQAEASQGSLQLFFEFQTMMSDLMKMDVANASLYDGATSVFEAVMMILRQARANPSNSVVYVPETLHPHYVQVLQTLSKPHQIKLVTVPFDTQRGIITLTTLQQAIIKADCASLILPQPNFFGQLEEADALTDWCATNNIHVIGVVNPVAMAWLKPPGEWGKTGADVACGEGQSLGVPLSSGGPYFGFFCCKEKYLRQVPGRLVGETVDTNGKLCYTLTLQAREQHIRRARATSNICTNQGLFVIAATIYMSLLGPEGLARIAKISHARAQQLGRALDAVGVKPRFTGAYFHERVYETNQETAALFKRGKQSNVVPGLELSKYYQDLSTCFLACTTELTDDEAIQAMSNLFTQEEALA